MYSKLIVVVLISAFALIGCGKGKETTDKKQETPKTEAKNNPTETKTESAGSLSNLFKITGVEKSAGKKIAPNFSWEENGKKTSLADLKGKVVLVNFWATWCGPCIKEMPALSAISQELKDKNFKMIGVNVFQQPTAKKIEEFLTTNPVSYTILDGNDEVVSAFAQADGKEMDAVPTTFILDKEGKIVETLVGGRDKASFLQLIEKYLK